MTGLREHEAGRAGRAGQAGRAGREDTRSVPVPPVLPVQPILPRSRRERVVLAFAGDIETSIAVRWLAETFGVEVVAMTLDFGHSRDLEEIRDRALALGAVRAHVLDVREEFAGAYLSPALRADALSNGAGRLASALGHAVIAAKLVEIAGIEQTNRVAHGGVTSARRITTAVHSLRPGFSVMAPACDCGMSGGELLDFAASRGLTLPVAGLDAATGSPGVRTFPPSPLDLARDDPDRVEGPLRVGEARRRATRAGGGSARDRCVEAPNDTATDFSGQRAAAYPAVAAAGEAAVVDISFKAGIPVALNGVGMPLRDLIGTLDFLAARNGIGRREPFEAPAVSVLACAHNELQHRASPGEMNVFSRTVGREYAGLVENGGWFGPLRAALDAYVDRAQQVVNGVVHMTLCQGACEIVQSHVGGGQEDDDNAVVGTVRHRA